MRVSAEPTRAPVAAGADAEAVSRPTARSARRYERFSPARLTVLKQLGKRSHRYRAYRFSTMIVSALLLFAVPLLGIARFDLFSGHHLALGTEVAPLYGLVAVSVAIFSFYFVTFQVNLFAGRMFCGFGCPVGQLNRLTDTLRAVKDPKQRLFWGVTLGAFVLALSTALVLWWTSPAVFTTWPGALYGFGAIGLLGGSAIAFARFWGWDFCMKACPIGLYYSVVQQKKPLGILFEKEKCLEEGACVKACPVQLDPRDLVQIRSEIGGFAIESLPANNHCLRCGACVEACDLVTSKVGPVALAYGRPERPIEIMWRSERLVQLPTRTNGAAVATLPAQALLASEDDEDIEPPMITPLPEPEQPIDWKQLFLTGGERGVWGTGLSLLWLAFAVALSGVVFVYWGGPLWLVARATSVTDRIGAATLVGPLVALVGLVFHRRISVGRWVNASGIVLGGASTLVTILFTALSPGSAFSYKPRETWETPAAEVQKHVPPYAAAVGAFESGTIEGRVLVDGAPARGVAVLVDHPRPGLPIEGSIDHRVDFDASGYVQRLVVARAGDRLLLANETDKFHTFILATKGRGVRNLPLPSKLSVKVLPAPAPGDYEVSCANHAGERAHLVVLDHGYVTWTGEDGSFQLQQVPAGDLTLIAVGADVRAELKLGVVAGRATRGDFSISRSKSENAKED